MGWYGREKLTKYYSVGFTEKELEEIDAACKKISDVSYFTKRTNCIRHLALTCIDIEKENRRLKNILEARSAESLIKQVEKNTTNAIFQEVIDNLSDSGKQTLLTVAKSLLENGHAKPTGETWTGYYSGVKKEGNIVFPKWG